MVIKTLSLKDFRNYEAELFEFSEGVNVLYGNNGQGKTNVLEAISLACTTKSHRKARDEEIIQFGKDESHITLGMVKREIDVRIDMHLRRKMKKAVSINSQLIRRSSELLGLANIVFFSPEDLNLVKNGPSERRRFIDLEACQLDRLYMDDLINYNKCLLQRNHLLKNTRMSHIDDTVSASLDVWDDKMSRHAIGLINSREKFVQQLNEIINPIHKSLTGSNEEIRLEYSPDTSKEEYKARLEKTRDKDLKVASTTIGPHRDDIIFLLNGMNLRKYGSQGQQRTVSLALKLSEIELVKRHAKDNPVLLLDDVLSELDSKRQKYLLQVIGNIQTVMTCTGLDEFVKNNFDIDKVFLIEHGSISLKQA